MKVNTRSAFYKWEVVLLLWFAYFLNQGDRAVFGAVLPHIQAFLGATDSTMGLISTCFNVFFALTVPFAGYFADRMSRKKIIVFSIALFSVATMFTGVANTVILFILFRSVSTGMGEAMFGPTYPAIIAEYHDNKTRATAMSLHQTAYYVGVVASTFLAGLIADKFGWQYSFLIFGGVGVLFTFVLVWRLKDKPKSEEELAARAASQPEGGHFAGFLKSFWESLTAIFRVPTAVFLIIGFSALIFVLTGYLTWMPKILLPYFEDLTTTTGFSAAKAGFHAMFWTHGAAFVGVLLAGWLSDRLAAGRSGGKSRLLLQAFGLLLATPCIVLMGRGSSLAVICAALAGFGFFRAFFDANTYSILYDVIPRKYHSSASSILQMCGFGIGSLAPLVLGWITDGGKVDATASQAVQMEAIRSSAAGLGNGIAYLAIVWLVAGLLLILASLVFFNRDKAKLQKIEQSQA
jgi:MFS family permease